MKLYANRMRQPYLSKKGGKTMKKKRTNKRNKKMCRPIAIGMALVLAASIMPKYTPVANAATGYVINEDASEQNVFLDKGTEQIVSAHSAIRFGADNGHTSELQSR